MPRTSAQNEKIKNDRKNDLLAASLNLFAVVGYKNVSVDLITEVAACSHGLFYHYFKSTDAIFNELLNNSDKFEFEPFNLKKIASLGGFEALEAIANYFGSEAVLNDAFLRYAKIVLTESNQEAISQWFEEITKSNSVSGLLEKFIKKGQKDNKVIDGDPKQIANVISTYLLAYVSNLINEPKKSRQIVEGSVLLNLISK